MYILILIFVTDKHSDKLRTYKQRRKYDEAAKRASERASKLEEANKDEWNGDGDADADDDSEIEFI